MQKAIPECSRKFQKEGKQAGRKKPPPVLGQVREADKLALITERVSGSPSLATARRPRGSARSQSRGPRQGQGSPGCPSVPARGVVLVSKPIYASWT